MNRLLWMPQSRSHAAGNPFLPTAHRSAAGAFALLLILAIGLAAPFGQAAQAQTITPPAAKHSGAIGSLTASKITLIFEKKATQFSLAPGVVVLLDGVSAKVGELKVGDNVVASLREEKGKLVAYKIDAHRRRKKIKD